MAENREATTETQGKRPSCDVCMRSATWSVALPNVDGSLDTATIALRACGQEHLLRVRCHAPSRADVYRLANGEWLPCA